MLITVKIYLPFPLILSKSNFEGISQADLHSASQGKRVKRTLEKRYLLEIHPLPICGSLFRHSLSRAALSQYTLSQVDVCSFASPFSLFLHIGGAVVSFVVTCCFIIHVMIRSFLRSCLREQKRRKERVYTLLGSLCPKRKEKQRSSFIVKIFFVSDPFWTG
jgi:hypothetical protein